MSVCSATECEKPRRSGNQRYCTEHHAQWMRENRKPASELSEEQLQKIDCRSKSNVLKLQGKLIPKPCECPDPECVSMDVQMHHEDYTKPGEVIWFTRACHLAHHKKLREAKS